MSIPTIASGRSKQLALTLTLLLSLAVLVSACGQPAPEFAEPVTAAKAQPGDGPDGKILFVADGEVSVWDGDVSTVIELNEDADYWTASPSWAPAGDRFAYVEMREGYSDIIIADASGDTLKQVTTNRPDAQPFSSDYACYAYWAFDPVWSPVGEQIIWVSDREGFEEYSCDPENLRFSDPMFMWYSEDVTRDQSIFSYILTSAVGVGDSQENPTLSPDGEQAAFTARVGSDSLRNTEIWSIDLDGGESTVLVNETDGAFDPAWSPDGDTIAYVQRSGSATDIWAAPADGSDPYQLTSIGTAVSPAWSPDGRYIAFFRVTDGEFEAAYVEVTESGSRLSASEPRTLFRVDNIHTPSGMSWVAD